MSIAIYARVSTERQVIEGFGLDVQMKELVDEAHIMKLSYTKYVDTGITGTSISKRKGLQKLLEDINTGNIKEVWVTKLSRLGRNTRDVLNIIHEFEFYNVIFKSKRDGIDTSTYMGKVMLQFMSIVAEMERDIIIETTRAGLEYRATLGKVYGCPPVLGYDRVGSRKSSTLIINEEESKVVKQIYSMYLKGFGYKSIVNFLNEKNYKTKKGKLFAINSVKVILSNPLYAGLIRYNYFKDWGKKRRRGKQDEGEYIMVKGLHQKIISKTKWNKVQEKMKSYFKERRVIKSGNYLLSGVLLCPQCSGKMSGVKSRYKTKKGVVEQRYYVCTNNRNYGKQVCGNNSIKLSEIDFEVLSYLDYVLEKINQDWSLKIKTYIDSSNHTSVKRLMNELLLKVEIDIETKKLSSITFKNDKTLFEHINLGCSKNKYSLIQDILSEYNF